MYVDAHMIAIIIPIIITNNIFEEYCNALASKIDDYGKIHRSGFGTFVYIAQLKDATWQV